MHESGKFKSENIVFERFFTINLDLLCIADMDGTFIKVNKAWENILAYSAEDLEGREKKNY